jgi:pyrimidine operon attenuation protein/uracil phosphoribosyltransferase
VSVRKTIDSPAIAQALETMASDLARQNTDDSSLIVVGIANGGIIPAERMARLLEAKLQRNIPTGVLNVVFHRDDIGRNPIPKESIETSLPDDVDDATVVLVEDVIASGRTVRAAIEELFSHGRPARVQLAALVDRGNRSLPFAPDATGFVEPTQREEQVVVRLDPDNPDNDTIQIFQSV